MPSSRRGHHVLALALTAILPIVVHAQEKPKTVGGNLVENGGFEEGNKGWNRSLKTVEDPVFEGKKACVLDNRAGRKTLAIVRPFVPLKPKTYYRFSMTVKRTNGQGYVYAHCNWYEAPGKRLMSSKNWHAGRAVPVTIRTGEATHGWQTFSGIFRNNRQDMGGVQLVIFIKNGSDVVYIDDVKIEELRYPDAPPWKLAEDVVFPGSPSQFHMSVEDAVEEKGIFSIRTTGAVYRLDPATGILTCRQRIEKEREVAVLKFSTRLGKLRIARKDRDVCVVTGDDVSFGFQGDSLVTIATNKPLEFTVTSKIGTKHFRSTNQHFLAIDDEGGFCAVTYARPHLNSPGSMMTTRPEKTSAPGWSAEYRIGEREMAGIAVFPARPFDWDRSFKKRIVNTGKCPDLEALREYSKYANVLFLFAGIYKEHYAGYCHAPYTVKDPEKLKQTIKEAHKLGMQVICYRHPCSYIWADIPLDKAIADMKAFRKEYKFDGWYFDGLYYAGSWMDTYIFIRTMRESVGPEGVIYTHCTLNPPARMCELYCPFIDSYSDFLLRGEGQTIRGPKDPYLRYVINTYKISNAIATLKGDKMLREGAEEPTLPKGKRLTLSERRAMWRKVGCSLRDQLDAMLRLNGRCRWAYPGWPLGKKDTEDYIGFYFKELDRMQAEWERTKKPLPMRWPM
ncbi:MAG: hypothetical protein GXP25_19635 [Planctomycetes bacterium]|nr:hypothetical protein [Planctomycetota bacterium]